MIMHAWCSGVSAAAEGLAIHLLPADGLVASPQLYGYGGGGAGDDAQSVCFLQERGVPGVGLC